MNWKLVECEIALIVSLTVIECVNMGQNSPKDITCLTVFFCIMIVLLPLIGVLQQWHLSCFQNRQKEKEYQAKQETDEKMKTWLLAREAIIKDKEKEELTNKVNGLQQKCDSLIENQRGFHNIQPAPSFSHCFFGVSFLFFLLLVLKTI